MSRNEFLQQLKEALENDLSGQVVQDNVNYYSNYIAEEVRGGKSEAEVLAMLGDPWILARNIIESPGGADYEDVYEPRESAYQDRESTGKNQVHVFGIDTWWKKLLLILVLVMVVVGVLALVTGVISFLAPILVPVIIVMIVVRMMGRGR